MPEIVQERTIEQRIAAIEDTCELIRADQVKLLEGITTFFAMAEQMKTNPQQRIAAIEDTCELIRADQVKLLEGIAKFFAMAEQMKGNPLFSALMPQSAPPQRKR